MKELLAMVAPPINAYYSGYLLFLILSGMGFFVGIITGLFGVGGGFLLVPLMNVLIGIPVDVAAGSTTCYIIGTSSSGVLKHWKNNNIEMKAAFYIAFGSIFGAVSGDYLQDFLKYFIAGGNDILFNKIMQSIFVLLLLVVGWSMYRKTETAGSGIPFLLKIHFGPVTTLSQSGIEGISIAGLFLIGLGGGLLPGLMGVSGGVLYLPILVVGIGLLPHLAVGTSLTIVFIASTTAVIKKGLSGSGKVSLPVAVSLLVAGTLGVKVGMALARKIHGDKLKRYFSLIAFAAAVMVFIKVLF